MEISRQRVALIAVILLFGVLMGCEEEYRSGYNPDGNSCSSCPQTDVAGVWVDTAGDGSTMTVTLSQSNGQVSGTFVDWQGRTGTVTGTVNGNRVEMTYTWSDGYVVENSAVVEDGRMSGTFTTPDGQYGTWTAMRIETGHDGTPLSPEPTSSPASTIWYSGVRNFSILLPPTVQFDANGDGKTDCGFDFDTDQRMYFAPAIDNAAVGLLSPGSLIDAQNPASGWFTERLFVAMWLITDSIPPEMGCAGGAWCGTNNGYIGLAFTIDGAVHYGWLRISIPQDGFGTLHDWAYETRASVGIKAGQME